MVLRKIIFVLLSAGLWAGCASREVARDEVMVAERKGVEFLSKDVPAWYKENGCFSCHNNGDAARALYLASRKGYHISAATLADTTAWLQRPQAWDDNKGDPVFSDQRLADVQFAAALVTAMDTGHLQMKKPLEAAAKRLVKRQGADGSWPIDASNSLGSPATYGAPLATYMAVRVLNRVDTPEAKDAVKKADSWLEKSVPVNMIFNSAVLLQALKDAEGEVARDKRGRALQLIQRSQTSDGGWGPYADAPPEVFDTAIVLLALAPMREQPEIAVMVQRGRRFLAANQYDDGSWPETTRPSGNESYAQRLSTTGWAVMALLTSRNDK